MGERLQPLQVCLRKAIRQILPADLVQQLPQLLLGSRYGAAEGPDVVTTVAQIMTSLPHSCESGRGTIQTSRVEACRQQVDLSHQITPHARCGGSGRPRC